METRQKRVNYRILNDGSDEEADPEDRIQSDNLPSPKSIEDLPSSLQATIDPSELSPSIAPSDSISQVQSSQQSSNDILFDSFQPRKKARLEQSSWLWNMFKIVPHKVNTFINPRTKTTKKEKKIYC